MSTKVPDSWDDEEVRLVTTRTGVPLLTGTSKEASPVRAPFNVQPANNKKQKIKDDWDDDDDDDEDSQATADAGNSTQAISK
jgi:hypothetical protein